MSSPNLDNLTEEELKELGKQVQSKLDVLQSQRDLERLKNSPILKKYSYIVFKEEDSEMLCIGFNAYNDPGYIDDHVPEEAEEDFYDMLGLLDTWGEVYSCTHEIDPKDLSKNEKTLADLGIEKMEPQW